MQRRNEAEQPEKKTPKLCLQAGKNERPGRFYVRLGDKRHYLGYGDDPKHPPVEVALKYAEAVTQWKKNKYRLHPTHVKTGISVEELAVKYLKWSSEQGYSKDTIEHCKQAMQFLIDHCGNLSTADFTRHTLKSLQEKLVTDGVHGTPYKRLTVNRYINLIKSAFTEGEERGWGIDENLPGQLARVRALRQGRTTAGEYQEREGVPDSTLPQSATCSSAW